VFVLGLVVVVGPAVWHPSSLFRDPFTAASETRTVETFDAKGVKTGTEVTTGPAGGSLVERSMAAGGVLLLRLAVVSAAAYLAGALVFRTLSGTFPSEIGGVKFAEEAAVGLETAEANIEVVRKEVAQITARLGSALDAIDRLAEAVVVLGDELRDLQARQDQ